ncbi:Methyltransferase type 12 [Cordyceps fumosorosea ARSEF 2679]|uniref:Methyltransferase type 12 n=1 Tax=Cordyceps fumosorosea (strain ARSEF 2679) TaxID=1081104 RepID=A0A167TPZ3_CORFA|nr:Methyltransferase type 12 [Cordyceps fumosorosea ARSEF 2679]OAA60826.1 Methyltransferase type 12 [Cordyceps fumosorosea ARSEF 2679]
MSDPSLARAALQSWDAHAAAWDASVGLDGNLYWKALQEPCLGRLLGDRLATVPSCRALELSTGNGIGARRLAAAGAQVTATDGSEGMLEGARGDAGGRIGFEKLDVTDDADFAPFVERAAANGGFDVVLMNMSMHDVATLEPLAKHLPQLLTKDGMFVAQLLHPVFMTSTYSKSLDLSFDPVTGERVIVRGKLIKEYLSVKPFGLTLDATHSAPLV